jgi:beta-lactam-binding protein with PASTA domain
MLRFLVGLATGVIASALIAIVVLFFADLEIVEEDSGPETSAPPAEETVEVPDVVGLERIAAETEIAEAGLEPKAETPVGANEQLFGPGAGAYSNAEVERQSPLAGTEVDPDTEVRLVLGVP